MGKLEGYNLIPFLFAYLILYQNASLDIDKEITNRVPNVFAKIPYIELVAVPLLFLSCDVEQTMLIWSYILLYKTTKMISDSQEKKIPSRFVPSLLLASLLVCLYKREEYRKHIVAIYGGVVLFCVLWIASGKTTFSDIVDDGILTHLIFYFTK
jgi:hypothetical protein